MKNVERHRVVRPLGRRQLWMPCHLGPTPDRGPRAVVPLPARILITHRRLGTA